MRAALASSSIPTSCVESVARYAGSTWTCPPHPRPPLPAHHVLGLTMYGPGHTRAETCLPLLGSLPPSSAGVSSALKAAHAHAHRVLANLCWPVCLAPCYRVRWRVLINVALRSRTMQATSTRVTTSTRVRAVQATSTRVGLTPFPTCAEEALRLVLAVHAHVRITPPQRSSRRFALCRRHPYVSSSHQPSYAGMLCALRG